MNKFFSDMCGHKNDLKNITFALESITFPLKNIP